MSAADDADSVQSYYDRLTPDDQRACLSDIMIYGTYAIRLVNGQAVRVPPHEIYKLREESTNGK